MEILLGDDRIVMVDVFVVGFHGSVDRGTPQRKIPVYETKDGQRIRIKDEPWKWSFNKTYEAEVYEPSPLVPFTALTRTPARKGSRIYIYREDELLRHSHPVDMENRHKKGELTRLQPFEDDQPFYALYGALGAGNISYAIRDEAELGFKNATTNEERRTFGRKVFFTGNKLLGLGMMIAAEDPFWVDFSELIRTEDETNPYAAADMAFRLFIDQNGESKDPSRVEAPFTDEQVRSLKDYQYWGKLHPFTGKDSRGDKVDLRPTRKGWVAENNGPIVQTWAHRFMTDWSWHPRGLAKNTRDISAHKLKVGDLLVPRYPLSPLIESLSGSKRIVRIDNRPSTWKEGEVDTIFVLEDGTEEMLIWPSAVIEVEETAK